VNLRASEEVRDFMRTLAPEPRRLISRTLHGLEAGVAKLEALQEPLEGFYKAKADRFRMEWAWAGALGQKMRAAVLADDWAGVALLSAQIAQKLGGLKVSENHRLGAPWVGAWQQLRQQP